MKSSWIAGVIIVLVLTACSVEATGGVSSPIVAVSPDLNESEISPSSEIKQSSTPDPALTSEPSRTPTYTVEPCSETQGLVESFSISRRELDITGRIYTPPCYGKNPDQSYPSLYLLHGATETDQQWEELGVFDLADELISSGAIPPLIIILPKEKSWIPLPENLFGDQIIKDLIPWVEGEYQTLNEREYRAVGGLSRGGNWAVRLGLLHWGLFGSIGAHSTPLFSGDLERIPDWMEAIPSPKNPRIYLDIGGADKDLPKATAFEEQLIKLEIPHTWHLYPGTHNEFYWKDHLAEYLLWYSSSWEEMNQE